MVAPYRYSEIRGTRIAWSQTGRGRPVVWAHGLTSYSRGQELSGAFDWRPVSAGHRLIRYDARGHGRSGGGTTAEEYTWPELGLDLLGLLDEVVAGEQVSGIGSSMGAATLLHAACHDRQRWDRLVLVTPPTMGASRREQVPVRLASADIAERQGRAALERLALDEPASPALVGARRYVSPIAVGSERLPWVLRGSAITDGPGDEQLAALDLPVLILCWTGDDVHPVDVGRHLGEVLPDATLQVASTPEQLRSWPQQVVEFLGRTG